MKKLMSIVSAASLAVLALSALPAHADGTDLSKYFDQGVKMQIGSYASGENNGQYYVGLTNVTISNAVNGATSFYAFCDDFTHEINVPTAYNAYVTPITTDAMKQQAYYGMMLGSSPSGNTTRDSELQELIWNYTAPADKQYAMNSDMLALQQQMLANYQGADYSNSWYLEAGDNGQSFMVTGTQLGTVAPTPEPPTLISLATGLFGMAGFLRRRVRNADAQA